ncbi:RNA exonuclease 1 [Nosema granulosis]|uniref:RNA exonuclease 1 n=1 Tax=Nosema granulosis TaxID=83296 RepID=A0A9P6H126_9MICR|nr:RNA exonuclease 1 [Nosema granulosis]
MKNRIEKLKLEDIYKFLLWFFNGRKKPSYIHNLYIKKTDCLVFYILTDECEHLPRETQTIKFHECLETASLPLVFTRNVIIEEIAPDLQFITEENLEYVQFIKLEQLFDSKIFINSSVELKCPNKECLFVNKSQYFLVSIDLEMVYSSRGKEVGRISILNHDGVVLYDKFVKSNYPVVDYCTEYSGLTPELLENGISNTKMKEEIRKIVGKNTVILGHGLDNDLVALEMYHPLIIDTSYLFINTESRRVSLKQLAKKYLNKKVHQSAHSSVEDAKLCLELLSIKIQQIKKAISTETEEIWLQAHIYNHTSCLSLQKNVQSGFNICVTTSKDIKKNFSRIEGAVEMIFYKSNNKILINI